MSDQIANPAVPATPQDPTPVAPVTPVAAPAEPTVTPSVREQVYDKYQRLYGEQPPAAQPVTPAAPAAPVEPVAPVTPVVEPQVPSLPPEILQLIVGLNQQVAELKTQLTPPAPVVPEPQPEDWFEKLKAGDRAGFEKALAAQVRKEIAQPTIEQAIQQATENIRAEREIETFVNDLRGANPELVPFEKFIAMDVQSALISARDAGKINSVQDYIKIYKDASNAALVEARKLYQSVRAAGKQEAQTIASTVVSAAPVPPTPVSPDRGGVTSPQTVEVESPESYLAKRQAAVWAKRGIPPQ